MAEPVPLDRDWLAAHPLPPVDPGTSKNERGHVLIAGGSRRSAGALRLAGEAAFRAGAGKVQLASIESIGAALGVVVPEAGILALPEGDDGQLAPEAATGLADALQGCDCLVLGPGMGESQVAGTLLDVALAMLRPDQSLVVDAAALRALPSRRERLAQFSGRCVLTPHAGEMAALLDREEEAVRRDPRAALAEAVSACSQVALIKGPTTFIAALGEGMLAFAGGGPGLATGGSGDVLAGIIGGLLARGQDPLAAAGWGVWLHGEAGRRLAETAGPIGYLARELIPLIPGLMRGFA